MDAILRDRRAILVFVGPALLAYTLILLGPVLWSLGYTFFSGNAIEGFKYVGLANITHLFHDPQFGSALVFTLKYAVVVTIGEVGCGLLLSLLYVFHLRRGSTLVRTLVFFPVVVPTVAVAEMFAKLFAIVPQYGIVNSFFHFIGWQSQVKDWLGLDSSAFLVLVIMDIWRSMGFYAVLLYAGLVDIPEEQIESARLDGASGFRLVRYVVLPALSPVLFSALIFAMTGTLKVFDSVLALTGGGPGQSTTPLTLYMFNTAFTAGQYGYASAIATALAIICLLVTLMLFGLARKDRTL
jgi:raffinose/stachyose/melibiose transport system permease protein